ncbi:hypothetical protein [Paenibacillus agricola]|uniref:Uncharacterized protein n=1 Tax=Paenibacillus agricola TaxID=2716264 RepID=A0ABX0J1J3_9BACL|nr:hypothetical protein [Paenibacillus agricola]NHN28984.1 hypothetical protein [Paenibacillus agricola]
MKKKILWLVIFIILTACSNGIKDELTQQKPEIIFKETNLPAGSMVLDYPNAMQREYKFPQKLVIVHWCGQEYAVPAVVTSA